MFCTETWRQEDILCHVFLHQASLVPGPAQCELPLGHHDMVDGEEGEEVETYKDEEGLNNININENSMARDQGNVQERHEAGIGLSDKSDFIVKEQDHANAENNARRAQKTFWTRDREKLKGRNNDQILDTLTDLNKDNSFGSLHLNDWKKPNDEETKEMIVDERIKGEGDFKVKQKVKVRDVVPRIGYYVLVSESCKEPFFFQFLHYLSMLSVQRFLRPRAIYVLGNCVPIGYWWSRVVNDVRAVRFVHRPRPLITKDGQVKWISHLADVIRLQVLLVNGGVYVDTDMILIRPLDPLLGYPLTMGLVDNNTGMGNALILATRGSLFLKEWYSGYRDFRPLHFHYNGMWAALRQWQADPDSVHMESKRFYSPNWYEANLLFYDNDYDISQSYAVHIWHRHAAVPTTPEQFLTLNTTLGRVFRRVYFGV
ncbi:hypothetical protein V1264_018302 [Littorina saxatilis]|uniref:Alpha-1,4-N-acetylglucosaminyltransferase n=2 Tax=Littorina saxatilis TaxID=31220 RepID=A0AAN9GCN5_9CAEN